jgi:tRNA (guanine37-N1)-methyltransferase
MRFDVITLFPDLVKDSFNYGVTGRALTSQKISLNTLNPRDFSEENNGKVDDRPYGGGPGMVLQPDPMIKAIRQAKSQSKEPYTIFMSPQGNIFNQAKAEEFSDKEHLVIVCGRYEGIDQRIIDSEVDEECSIGGYILSGGELPALIVMDSVARTLQGVLGDADSVNTDTFSDGLLKHPQYTRPETGSYGDVPEILLSGDHESIRRWQLKQSLLKTRKNRPDLLEERLLNEEEQGLLEEIIREEKS